MGRYPKEKLDVMLTPNVTIRYVLYARKSEEAEDRQVQSIEDQENYLKQLVSSRGLAIVRTFSEARSAKAPGQRPEFEKMVQLIEKGSADGIVCWQINRLSRNPVESGRLAWLLQRGVIRSILTHDREYRPEDNALIFSVETGMANQFILELSRNVKRGLQGKLDRGGLPGRAPIGYLNVTLNNLTKDKVVAPDSERFAIVRQGWDLMLSGGYNLADLARKFEELGLTAPVRRRSGGKPLKRGALYKLFRNPFYAGIVRRGGRDYPGKHEAMVSLSEFERVQELLGNVRHHPKRFHFTFAQLLRCGECGSMITAEIHTKYIKAAKAYRTYRYYRCTWRGRLKGCTQKKYISEEALNAKIAREITAYELSPAARTHALAFLREHANTVEGAVSNLRAGLERGVSALRLKLQRLVQMFYSDLVTESVFLEEQHSLQTTLAHQEQQLREADNKTTVVRKRVHDVFHFATELRERFENGTMEEKRLILTKLWSNRILRDGRLHFEPKEWFKPLERVYEAVRDKDASVEPKESPTNTIQNGAFAPVSFSWSALVARVWNEIQADELRILCLPQSQSPSDGDTERRTA